MPVPLVLAKVTEVALSPVRTLLLASRTSAVSVRAAPEVRLPVALVTVRWSAAPATTLKVSASEARSGAEAVTVTEPASRPEGLIVATPLAAVAAPSPASEPLPAVWAKVTLVVLSVVMVLPAASWIVPVSARVAPEARLATEPPMTTLLGGAGDDREGGRVAR